MNRPRLNAIASSSGSVDERAAEAPEGLAGAAVSILRVLVVVTTSGTCVVAQPVLHRIIVPWAGSQVREATGAAPRAAYWATDRSPSIAQCHRPSVWGASRQSAGGGASGRGGGGGAGRTGAGGAGAGSGGGEAQEATPIAAVTASILAARGEQQRRG